MPVPTTSQLQRLRSRPHRTRLWLGVYEPVTIVSAQINHSGISKGERDITVTYLSGDWSKIVSGMTCYIGSSAGEKDLGRIRCKGADATTINLAENSRDWHENWFLTVVEYYEPWTVFPRITLDDDNNDTWFKDYDIGYNDQNQILDPIVCMGPNHAGFLPYSGAYSIWYTSSGTQDPSFGATFPAGAAYDWYFGPTGSVTPSGSTAADPGWVTYHSSSFYTTRLTVTTAEGKSYTGYRHIMVYEKPDEGPQRPIVEWGIENFGGSRDEGGYEVNLWIRERAGFSKVVDGALIVIWSDDWQDGVSGAIGGNAQNRESILFVGYIQEDSIDLDPITNRLEFTAESISGSMKDLGNYSVTLENKENAMLWWQMRFMTVDRAVIHLLRWHSTVLAVCDFHPTGDTKQVQYADFDRDALYDAANEFLESTLGARMVSDRQGKLWCEVDIHITPTGSERDGTFPTLFDVSRRDWRSEITFERLFEDRTAYLELGGIGYAGPVTGSEYGDPYLAGAPGEAAGYRGGVDREQGLVLASQHQLNVLTGNWLARINANFPAVTIPIAGDYRVVDIAPQERLTVSLEADDTWRRLVWDEKRFVPTEIDYEYDPGEQSLLMDLTVREETYGEIGATIEIPVTPPWDDPGDPRWDNPRWPPLPPLPPLPPPVPPPGSGDLVYVATSNRITRSRNFTSVFPNWEDVSTTGTAGASVSQFWLDPFDTLNGAYLQQGQNIYKTSNLNSAVPTWTQIYSQAIFTACWPGRTDALYVMGVSGLLQGLLYTLHKNGYMCRSMDDGASWVAIARPQTGGANPVWGFKILPSYHSPSVVFVLDGYWSRIYKSWTFGSAWQNMTTTDNTCNDFDVPFHDNPGDNRWAYSTRGVGANADNLYFTDDDRVSKVAFTPWWDGNAWGTKRGDPIPWNYQIKTHPTGYAWAMMLNRDLIEPNDVQSALWYWPNGILDVGTRELRYVFSNYCRPLTWHPTDILKLYTLGNATDGYILGSEDGGWSWANKLGDWETAIGTIGAPDNLGFSNRQIMVVPGA